jgi:lipopolysaccharide export system protein LptA
MVSGGSPATSLLTWRTDTSSATLRRPGTDEITYAEAGKLSYDVNAGIIEFSEQATINEGGNQISSNFLVYNITEQRINAQGNEDGRVRIKYTPTNGTDTETDSAADAEAVEGEDENP